MDPGINANPPIIQKTIAIDDVRAEMEGAFRELKRIVATNQITPIPMQIPPMIEIATPFLLPDVSSVTVVTSGVLDPRR